MVKMVTNLYDWNKLWYVEWNSSYTSVFRDCQQNLYSQSLGYAKTLVTGCEDELYKLLQLD